MSRGSAFSWASVTLAIAICIPQTQGQCVKTRIAASCYLTSSLLRPAGALSLSADLLAFSKALNFTPQGWSAGSSVPACNWAGITCQPLAANGTQFLSIDLSGKSLGSSSLPGSWATLPSLAQGLTSLNLTANVLQVLHEARRHAHISPATALAEPSLLQGTLPGNWSSGFTVLQALVLDDNLITGEQGEKLATHRAQPALTLRHGGRPAAAGVVHVGGTTDKHLAELKQHLGKQLANELRRALGPMC